MDIPIPNDSLPYETLSLYSWDGTSWHHIPSTVLEEDVLIESRLDFVPDNFSGYANQPRHSRSLRPI
ncbi:MAG: hypothetical protein R2932_08215 [Caldilineaceae bacterium]